MATSKVDEVTSKILSFNWNAIEPLVDIAAFTEAVEALSPDTGTPEFDARDRFLKAAAKHAAAAEGAKAKSATPGGSSE